jgi:hypothetical protein
MTKTEEEKNTATIKKKSFLIKNWNLLMSKPLGEAFSPKKRASSTSKN